MILAVRGPRNASWLVDSAADVQVCNDRILMTEYHDKPTRIGGSTADGVSPGRGKVRLCLSLKDDHEGVVLNLNDVFFLPSSPSNVVSLGLLNIHGIFYNNENETLYDRRTKETLAYAERCRTSFLLHPLNLSVSATHLKQIDNNMYEWPPHAYRTSNPSKLPLTTWHNRLGHLNFPSLKQHLHKLEIEYIDDSANTVCDSCQRAKATKIYNRHNPQKRANEAYQFIHTDLVGPINPVRFGGEKYFFTFTDDFTLYTEVYTGTHKSEWFECLKIFYNLCKTWSHKERPVERLRSDYGSELLSKRVEEWLTKKGITFEPSAPYSQEQNGVSERMGRTIMDMTRVTILEGNLDDELWPEIVLAMTYVKNVRPTKALGGDNPYHALQAVQSNIQHLRVLGSIVYVLLHEEERDLKSEKWNPRALRGTFVGYDGHTIYRVHIR